MQTICAGSAKGVGSVGEIGAGALAEDPAMDGAALGTAICDTYYEGCEAVGTQDQTTLSVTDLTKLQPLLGTAQPIEQEDAVSITLPPRSGSAFLVQNIEE